MIEFNRDFAKNVMRVGAREAGQVGIETLPKEVRPAAEAFRRGFRQQRRQEQPKDYPTRSRYMTEVRNTSQGLTATRAALAKIAKTETLQWRGISTVKKAA